MCTEVATSNSSLTLELVKEVESLKERCEGCDLAGRRSDSLDECAPANPLALLFEGELAGKPTTHQISNVCISRHDPLYYDQCKAGNGELQYTNGDFYEGESLDDMRHGQGKLMCASGDVYVGQWRLDQRHGKGKATFKSGLEYEGDWREDKAHGHGRAQYENGGIYEGDFQGDVRSGWGRHTFPGGDVYEGEWLLDVAHGKGRHTASDGSFYEGEWRNGELSRGRLTSVDGAWEYKGDFRGGQRCGKGLLVEASVRQYKGRWEADKEEGYGECRWADGATYQGHWKAGMRHGTGMQIGADGATYTGEWDADAQHGRGSAVWLGGERYTGEWRCGMPEGMGRCQTAEGDVYEGGWHLGMRHGRGVCVYANGDKYTGEWEAGKRHGQGLCIFANGTRFQGEWEEDCWVQSLAEPSLCRVGGRGLTRATAGQPATFHIEKRSAQAKDELRNQRLCGGDKWRVWGRGPASIQGTVTDNGNATYSATYTATVAGLYMLHVTNSVGEPVAESPYPLQVNPAAPLAKTSTITGAGRSSAVCGAEAHFVIEPRDPFGNRCWASAVPKHLPVEITLTGSAQRRLLEAKLQEDGTYIVQYTVDTPGHYRLEVTSSGRPIGGSPHAVLVRPGDEAIITSTAPIMDEVTKWGVIAEEEYGADGVMDGWEDVVMDQETPEQKYIKAHPEVPVVENLEDLWKLGKLQRERKLRAAQEEAAALKAERA